MSEQAWHDQAWWQEQQDLAFKPWSEARSAWWPGKLIVGTPGDDTLHGGKGDDTIDGGEGADQMAGRKGNDTYLVDNAGDVVIELDHQGTDSVVSSVDYTLPAYVENLDLVEANYPFDLNGTGNDLDNHIDGTAGNNRLEGLGGDDFISSGGLIGPYGSDTLLGGLGNDTLVGGGAIMGEDQLYGGAGDDVLQVGQGANALYGEDGNDLLQAGSGGPYGSGDYLSGGAGRDTLVGGAGLDGGDGADLMTTTNVTSFASGGLGSDTITGTGGSGYSNLWVDGGGGQDVIDVLALNNRLTLTGGAGDDTLRGGAGMGVDIDGGSGDDLITGYKLYPGGPLSIKGGAGNDTIAGSGAGDFTIDGGTGHDQLSATGQLGYSLSLDGGIGNDTISAWGGEVQLIGNAGSDTFLLTGRDAGGNILWTQDFASGVDRLAVSQSTLPVGNGDLVVDNAVAISGPGGFDAGAELVIVTADLADGSLLEQAAAAIGSANQAYAAGQTAVFMVDDGHTSYALYFQSSGADATVSADELSVMATLLGTPSTGVGDVAWGP